MSGRNSIHSRLEHANKTHKFDVWGGARYLEVLLTFALRCGTLEYRNTSSVSLGVPIEGKAALSGGGPQVTAPLITAKGPLFHPSAAPFRLSLTASYP